MNFYLFSGTLNQTKKIKKMMEEAEDQALLEAQGNEMNMTFIYFHMTVD